MLSEYDRQNIQGILSGGGDWFTAKLLRLIAHSDGDNRALLFKAYPEEVHLVNVHNWGEESAEQWKRNQLLKAETEFFRLRK